MFLKAICRLAACFKISLDNFNVGVDLISVEFLTSLEISLVLSTLATVCSGNAGILFGSESKRRLN